jgi:SAM-dependent methyltransferase
MVDPRPAAHADRSYDPERVSGTFEDEIARLRAQVALSWCVEQRRLSALGVSDGQSVLELGCGPGFVTERLCEWLPTSRIVALDWDERMIHVARQTLQRHVLDGRLALLVARADATALPDDTFDLAISRYLFQHLPDPVTVAQEVRRVLRSGGVHVIIDVDDGLWGLAEPGFTEFEAVYRQRASAQRNHGGERFRGRRLGRILREAGYVGVELDVFAYDSDDVGLETFASQLDPDRLLPLVDEGQVTLTEYAKAKALYERFLKSSGAFVLSVAFIARGKNPR